VCPFHRSAAPVSCCCCCRRCRRRAHSPCTWHTHRLGCPSLSLVAFSLPAPHTPTHDIPAEPPLLPLSLVSRGVFVDLSRSRSGSHSGLSVCVCAYTHTYAHKHTRSSDHAVVCTTTSTGKHTPLLRSLSPLGSSLFIRLSLPPTCSTSHTTRIRRRSRSITTAPIDRAI